MLNEVGCVGGPLVVARLSMRITAPPPSGISSIVISAELPLYVTVRILLPPFELV